MGTRTRAQPWLCDFHLISHSRHLGEVGHRVPGLLEEDKQLAVWQPPWLRPILTTRPWWPGFPGRPTCPALPCKRQNQRHR